MPYRKAARASLENQRIEAPRGHSEDILPITFDEINLVAKAHSIDPKDLLISMVRFINNGRNVYYPERFKYNRRSSNSRRFDIREWIDSMSLMLHVSRKKLLVENQKGPIVLVNQGEAGRIIEIVTHNQENINVFTVVFSVSDVVGYIGRHSFLPGEFNYRHGEDVVEYITLNGLQQIPSD